MARVKTSADLAERLVDEAGRIFSTKGSAALTLRRLAAEAGTTTMSVYTLFGDKQGLLAAMYREGFARLAKALRAAGRATDPLEALANMGLAYRRTARKNPHLYDLMFGRPITTLALDDDSLAIGAAAYEPLVEVVGRCLTAGVLANADADTIASYLWAVSHGVVTLELAGHLPATGRAAEAQYRDAMTFAIVPFLAPPAGPGQDG